MWVKKIITIFILSTTIVFSQDKYEILENLNDDLTLLIYEEVVNVDGVPKDILFERIVLTLHRVCCDCRVEFGVSVIYD